MQLFPLIILGTSCFVILMAKCSLLAMLQADDEDEMMEQQMKSPFGSSFRTFDATDYKPIGTTFIQSLGDYSY